MRRHFSSRSEALAEIATAKSMTHPTRWTKSGFSRRGQTGGTGAWPQGSVPLSIHTTASTKKRGSKDSSQSGVGPPKVGPAKPDRAFSVRPQARSEVAVCAEELEHTADRAFHVRGRNFTELLEKAAQALVALDGEAPVSERFIRRAIEVHGSDPETLLVNWLNEILYLEQTQCEFYDHFLLSRVTETHLCAQLYGRQLEHSVTSLKAVTFHNLKVKQSSEGLEATVVVDV